MEAGFWCCRDQKVEEPIKAAKSHGAESPAQHGVDAGRGEDARTAAEKEGLKDRVKASLARMHSNGSATRKDGAGEPQREGWDDAEPRVRPCHQADILALRSPGCCLLMCSEIAGAILSRCLNPVISIGGGYYDKVVWGENLHGKYVTRGLLVIQRELHQ